MENPDDTQRHEGYIMDAENASEMARLMLQDQLFTETMGGVLAEQPDPSQIHQVLDIACGPGGWLLKLTEQYPHMHGIGVDISQLMIEYATHLVQSQRLSNVEFRVMDVTQPLNLPDNTFDLINGRILTGFLSTQQWPTLLQECSRITQPGGVLRLTEGEWAFTNSAAHDALTGLFTQALRRGGHSFSPNGRTGGTINVLRLLLRQAGYQNIQYRVYALDFSAGTPAHEMNVQNHLVVLKQLQPFLAQMQVASQEKLDALYQQMEEDFQKENFGAIDILLTVWGYKP